MKLLRVLLALVPVAAILGGAFFANRIRPFVLGLPFFVFWICAAAVATAALMGLVYLLDPANREPEDG